MERKIEEKILWINSNYKYSGVDNNFIYDIAGYIHPDARNITVQMLSCSIRLLNVADQFDVGQIKILCDFGVSHNCYNSLNNFIVLGLINSMYNVYKYCDEMNKKGPIYKISFPTRFINIYLVGYTDEILLDSSNNPPANVILCLKFKYEI